MVERRNMDKGREVITVTGNDKETFDFKSYLQSLSPRAVLTNPNENTNYAKKNCK